MDRVKSRIYAGTYVLLTTSVCFTCAFITDKDEVAALLHRSKRAAVSCHPKYRDITPGHTACLPSSSKVKKRGISTQDKRLIIEMHNKARREVNPTSSNMVLMTWDDEIANTAQRWAENCEFNHDNRYKRYAFGRFSVGQNLAWGTHMTWQSGLQLLIDERKDYTYGSRGNNAAAVGHYTQIVWAESVKVGCGYALCDHTFAPMHYYVCDYGPGGNLDISKPYKRGTTCGDCPNRCNNGLCDCGGKVCLNGGTMDLNTCTCSCKKDLPFFLEPDCALNCTDVQDAWYCSQWAGTCERYSNVPQECPKMCNICPTGGKGYGETGSATMTSSLSLMTCLLPLVTCLLYLRFNGPLF